MTSTTCVVIEVETNSDYGWRKHVQGLCSLWFKGYIYNHAIDGLLTSLRRTNGEVDAIETIVQGLDGHFALIYTAPEFTLAAGDRIRSIPLFYGEVGSRRIISSSAETIRKRLQLTEHDIDADQALTFATSGFCFSGKTLYRAIQELKCGEFAVFKTIDGAPDFRRYYRYLPSRKASELTSTYPTALAESLNALFSKVADEVSGRCVVVPLSAGLDSRLIVSGLRQAGHTDIRCFAYGLPHNFEAEASRSIAERLELPWTFVPLTPPIQCLTFQSEACRNYVRYSGNYSSVPFQQELHSMSTLIEKGFIPRDSVVLNGQSGDFITGNHIPAELGNTTCGSNWPIVRDTLIAKHYSHWESLKTPENQDRIDRLLKQNLQESGCELEGSHPPHAVYELSEYDNRQAKYVVNGQRLYEFLGLEWRLPLWDRDFVDLWRDIPVGLKLGQNLYRETLQRLNYCGVWDRLHYPERISPPTLRPLRLFAKAMHAPFGRRAWHQFEKNWFAYWMDVVANYAVVPYSTVRRDRRGHRNAISWHIEAYLRDMDISFDSEIALPLRSAAR